MMDKRFRVEVLSQTETPQRVAYFAMHQDYSEGFVWDRQDKGPTEEMAGKTVVERLLNGGRGHFGPLEHPQIVLNIGWFPHSCMQQIRTHRVGVSFDVQSFRYSGQRIVEVAEGIIEVEDVFYLRPVGFYTNREGKKYQYTQEQRVNDLAWCVKAAEMYAERIDQGFAEEHARSLIPFDVRQHWVMSANVRSLMHLMDLRAKADAQLECQQMCELIWPHFESWVPAIAGWYQEKRWKKARLAP
jgi:thymidylate synthase (FAD)